MAELAFPRATRDLVERRRALDVRAKQLIAMAVAHVTQCPWFIEGHVKAARRQGASAEQIMEAIWVAAEMRAGASSAHAIKALDVLCRPEGA